VPQSSFASADGRRGCGSRSPSRSFGSGLGRLDFDSGAETESSKWIKGLAPDLSAFYWQQGYGAFSICPSHVAPWKKYIAAQEEHHRRETFQDEFRRLLKKYGVEYDERYVWD
jgi:hypothetical protein